MPLQLRDRDRGYRELLRNVGVGSGADSVHRRNTVLVGISGPKASAQHADSQLDVVTVASFAEFGLGQPERSFIRAWVDEERDKILALIRRGALAVVRGKMSKEQALEVIGAKLVAMCQARIKRHIPPPNAPATIAAKGSDVPLIDKGQLWSSITYLVEKLLG